MRSDALILLAVVRSGALTLLGVVRSDALTPALSHRERGQTLKTATNVAVLLLPPQGEGANTKKATYVAFCGLFCALTYSFKQADTGGDRHVQRRHAARHRNADELVAMLARQTTHPLTFRTHILFL